VAKRYARALAEAAEGRAAPAGERAAARGKAVRGTPARGAAPGRAGAAAREAAALEATAGGLLLAAEVVGRDRHLLRFFADPSIGRSVKEKAIATLCTEADLSDLVRRFLGVLVENRRMAALPAIARSFEALKDERLGIVAAEATTAVALSAGEQKRLRESLETLTGRAVRLAVRVDPGVLGGARTRIGSKVYDGTLKRQLAALRERLAGSH
jgi:F-type H+-transporting ATPase subunit delta